LHNEELHTFYSLQNIRKIKLRTKRRAGHVAGMGENFCSVNLKKLGLFENLDVRWEVDIRTD
jgi:hypothetical protein